MKVVAYLRVSTDKQEDNNSIPAQEAQIRNWATLGNHEIVEIHSDVKSGRETDRPGFWAALGAIESGRADGMVCASLDRFARNVRFFLKVLDEKFTGKEKQLFLLDMQTDYKTAFGRVFYILKAALAEYEVRLIMERTSLGRAFKSLSGGYAFGAPPYGETTAGGHLIEVPEEQATIKTIVDLWRKGFSLREIATRLTALGVKTKRGGKWAAQTIKNILDKIKRRKK